MHLDLWAPRRQPLLRNGATMLAEHHGWSVLADPEGNEFCVFPSRPNQPAEPPARPFALCVDSDRPEQLAAWWSARTRVKADPAPDGTPRWLRGVGWGPFEIIWKFVRVFDARTAENRLRWDVCGDAADLAAAGATPARAADTDSGTDTDAGSGEALLHDPQGNAFGALPPG